MKMKQIFFAAVFSLIGQAALANGEIICTNGKFSNLTVSLQPESRGSFVLTVLAEGAPDDYMPRIGETASLTVDEEVSQRNYLVLRSEYRENEKQRAFSMSFLKSELAKGTFRASMLVSSKFGDFTFVSYDMNCERK